jgi:hypothetical protein
VWTEQERVDKRNKKEVEEEINKKGWEREEREFSLTLHSSFSLSSYYSLGRKDINFLPLLK